MAAGRLKAPDNYKDIKEYELAWRYYNAIGVKVNLALAIELLTKLAEQQNYFPAMVFLAHIYLENSQVPIPITDKSELAKKWFIKAAEYKWEGEPDKKIASAFYYVQAMIHGYGYGVPVDKEKSKAFLEAASKQEYCSPFVLVQKGTIIFHQAPGNAYRAGEYFKTALHAGLRWASHSVFICSKDAESKYKYLTKYKKVEKTAYVYKELGNLEFALHHYSRACRHYSFTIRYGISQNTREIIRSFKQAKFLGGQYGKHGFKKLLEADKRFAELAWNYKYGIIFSKNEAKAAHYEKLASEQKDSGFDAAIQKVQGMITIPFQQIKPIRVLNRGHCGFVYEASYNGKKVAVKQFHDFNRSMLEILALEASVHMELDHPNVMKIFGVTSSCGLVMELMKTTSDIDFNSVSPIVLDQICLGAAKGLSYMHKRQFLHRDIKHGNILLDQKNEAKIADLGFALKFEGEVFVTNMVGTYCYLAPEIACEEKAPYDYSKASDVYAFGFMALEIQSGQDIEFADTHATVKEKLKKGERPHIPNDLPKNWINLITRCWASDPKQRPSMEEVEKEIESFRVPQKTSP